MGEIINFLQKSKLVIIIVISLIIGWLGSTEYQKYQSKTDLAKPLNKQTKKIDTTNNSETVKPITAIETIKPTLFCPNIIVTSNYEFTWDKDVMENKILYLSPDFLKNAKFSDGFSLANLQRFETPSDIELDPSTYSGLYGFQCEKGSKAGENINKLYCKTSVIRAPELIRNTIDANGNITRTDRLYITAFIFNIEGKNINNLNDLKDLKPESTPCTNNHYDLFR